MSVHYSDDSVTVYHGDALDVLAEMPDASVDAVCTDPPYSLGFMNRAWDVHDTPKGYETWCYTWAVECLRLLKPGGHLLAFGGTRTFHRLACAIEDAGFEIRDTISWLYGSGFPKSLDVSKAIDRAAGAEREVVGSKLGQPGYSLTDGNGDHRTYGRGLGNTGSGEAECAVTAPATDDARRWQGWGTALKPAWEPVIVARKPLAGTVAGNVLAHGTGALNIDGTRIEATDGYEEQWDRPVSTNIGQGGSYISDGAQHTVDLSANKPSGRWPANVVLDEDAAAQLDRQSGTSVSSRYVRRAGDVVGNGETHGLFKLHEDNDGGYSDSGGASRFYYTAKAAPDERPRVNGVSHPTVKPLDLMRWLVRLVTPPGGLVLDPFAGSGTTGEACVIEGFRCVLIEREADYLPLIEARLSKPIQPTLGGAP